MSDSLPRTVSVTELRDRIREIVGFVASDEGEPVVVIKHSRPVAVLLSYEEWALGGGKR